MSQNVVEQGEFIQFSLSKEEAFAECERLGVDTECYPNDPWDALVCETAHYIQLDTLGFCKILELTEHGRSDFCNITPNLERGSYSFLAMYYDGGGTLVEVLDAQIAHDIKQARGNPITLPSSSDRSWMFEPADNFLLPADWHCPIPTNSSYPILRCGVDLYGSTVLEEVIHCRAGHYSTLSHYESLQS
jgi:hypothetical protein